MRFLFKTDYQQDVRLFKHGGQVFWYGLLLAALLVAPWLLPDYYVSQLVFIWIYAIAGIGLMILVGFSGGTDMGIYCIIVYVVIHLIDGNIIVPLVAKKTVDLAPALVLGAQLIMGVLFGVLGLLLADPMVAMIKIWLEREAARHEPLVAD